MVFAISAKSQDFVFNTQQTGKAYKNNKTGTFGEAELNDANIKITVQNNVVTFYDSSTAGYILKTEPLKKKKGLFIINEWLANDKNNYPVTIRFIINKGSKDAIIEVVESKLKKYFFGYYQPLEKIAGL